jgi:hypothetical protein
MTASTEPRSGIFYGWDLGESGWNTGMDSNLLFIGRVGMHLRVEDRDVTDPTSLTPSDGDAHIVGASATGDWSGHDDEIAVWDSGNSQWVFYVPDEGWICYIKDEEVLSSYKGTSSVGWSAGVAI